MAGELFRLKNWTDYRRKLAKGEPGMICEGFKTTPGMHTVMVAIGSIDEKEEITEEWVKEQMKGLGWWPLNGPKG